MHPSPDILAVADALEQSGMDTRQAHACATQMHLVAHAREAVTRPEVEAFVNMLRAEIAKAKAELGAQIADVKNEFNAQFAEINARFDKQSNEFNARFDSQAAQTRADMSAMELRLEKRMVALFWRFFGGMVVFTSLLATVVLTIIRYLPPAAGGRRLTTLRPIPQIRLSRRPHLVQPPHRQRHRRLFAPFRVHLRLRQYLRHGINEPVQRLLALRLRRLDQ